MSSPIPPTTLFRAGTEEPRDARCLGMLWKGTQRSLELRNQSHHASCLYLGLYVTHSKCSGVTTIKTQDGFVTTPSRFLQGPLQSAFPLIFGSSCWFWSFAVALLSQK